MTFDVDWRGLLICFCQVNLRFGDIQNYWERLPIDLIIFLFDLHNRTIWQELEGIGSCVLQDFRDGNAVAEEVLLSETRQSPWKQVPILDIGDHLRLCYALELHLVFLL